MYRLECENLGITDRVRLCRAVIDDIPNEELLVFAIDIRDEGSHFGGAKLHAEISDRLANPSFFIGSEHDERNRRCPNSSEPWDAQLPVAQYLKKQCLECLIDFVDLIH